MFPTEKEQKKMKKLIASLILIAAPMVATVAVVVPAAHAAEVNAGWCRQSINPQQRQYMAPGVSNNGPLVFVGGNPVSTNGVAFEGWVGCYK